MVFSPDSLVYNLTSVRLNACVLQLIAVSSASTSFSFPTHPLREQRYARKTDCRKPAHFQFLLSNTIYPNIFETITYFLILNV